MAELKLTYEYFHVFSLTFRQPNMPLKAIHFRVQCQNPDLLLLPALALTRTLPLRTKAQSPRHPRQNPKLIFFPDTNKIYIYVKFSLANPDAQVVALSPSTLLSATTFVCDICGREFRRDQNLQIHRRGHHLSCKLPPRGPKETKKRVYICPMEGCVYHDPSRALGDLTGIKKHYCRKHGEKRWKCRTCHRKYAVKTDWNSHVRVCGTRSTSAPAGRCSQGV